MQLKLLCVLQLEAIQSDKKKKLSCQKNVRLAVKEAGIAPVAPNKIVDGNLDTALMLMWRLIQKFRMDPCIKFSERHTSAEKSLLEWCQFKTEPYPSCGKAIVDFDRSWMSGLPFVALLHWRDETVHFDAEASPKAACESAFTAGAKMGIPRILEVSDICDRGTAPDKQIILTYVAETYHVLNDL